VTAANTAKRPPQRRSPRSESATPSPPSPRPFPIVGIGASAGGLEALELFLKNVSPESRAAFVVVQHMDPTHRGLLTELLGRVSPLPVAQVAEGTRVQAGHVYVIPPNKDMSIVNGVLHLLTPVASRGFRLPIDFFFRSLADDLAEGSIGVLLSGMGSDGTLGLRDIRGKAGAAFVQDPSSAKFDAMPRSAIDAGLADVVAPAQDLPLRIDEYVQHARRPDPSEGFPAGHRDHGALEIVIGLLRTSTSHDFSLYKRSTIQRRVERRMGLHRLEAITDYVRYLRENPAERELLFQELLIGVTSFFRDAAAWDQLRTEVLPAWMRRCADGAVLRAWVSGCSTGEEAYSLGIVFQETLAELKPAKNLSLQIFATDLDHTAIARARQGLYPSNITSDVSAKRLARFFLQENGGYRVRKEVRDLVVFATQSVTRDPPFTKLDLLTCRNLLIYLTQELQRKLVPLFHYALAPGGVLFLGSAETIGEFAGLFEELPGKRRLYRRREGGAEAIDFPSSFAAAPPRSPEPQPQAHARIPNLQTVVDQALATRFAPAAVLATAKGDVVYVHGRTGKYLEPPAGKANWNVFAMARAGLRPAFGVAFQDALASRGRVVASGLAVETDGGRQIVDVTIEAMHAPAALRGTVLITFSDAVAAPPEKVARGAKRTAARSTDAARLEQELKRARDELQSMRQDMQASEEDLQSTNEELQSTNEELQSTNEELTTSKEEMQSMNEELQTLNHELQAKLDELSRTGNDMKNLLDSTEIAVLFLDEALNVRRFTPKVATLFKLISGDVGRPLADLATDLVYPGLYDDARDVLRTLVFKETQVKARDGRWFSVRIMPYRATDNRIDGVVITCTQLLLVADPTKPPSRSGP
jgi:two-component system CheB/CheR fusion protein